MTDGYLRQDARMAWIVHRAAQTAGIPITAPTATRLAQAMSQIMFDDGIYLEYRSRFDEPWEALTKADA